MSYDAVVIGGGLAGGTVAYHLARRGYGTLVVEKQSGPHHKVCGEFLSGETRDVLLNMGIDLTDAPVISRLTIASRLFEARVRLPLPGLGLSRYRLDEDVLNCAAQAGAEIRRGTTVHGYAPDGTGFHVKTDAGNVSARGIFLATGKHDLRGDTHRHTVSRSAIGFKMHLRFCEHAGPPCGGQCGALSVSRWVCRSVRHRRRDLQSMFDRG